ncbi:MAG: prepilin-type N-terminal cleavage/methylation domain-containing protein [Lachnospiraceae bacterium]|nr:prepilin-type N-terminal cleavage/methylation domain-containing protein [Lachnospiraceae bacterium]
MDGMNDINYSNNKRKCNRLCNNRGVSLIELVVAMALFAIVIVPICASFITSMRVNQKSRKMMAANDLAQSIVEGYSGKTYEDVKLSIASIGTADLSGNLALSTGGYVSSNVGGTETVSVNVYNMKENGVSSASWNGMINVNKYLDSVSRNEIKRAGGTAVSTNSLISENKAIAVSLNRAAAEDFLKVLGSDAADYRSQKLIGVTDTDGTVSFLCYTGLHSEGYYFDAVVMFIPMARTAAQKYYSYEAMVYVYEVDRTDMTTRLSKEPVLSLMTGIKNRNG